MTQSPLTLLHVIPRKGDPADAEHLLAQACEQLPSEAVETRIRQGDPTSEILAEIEEGDYDLVVVGANESTGLRRQLLGSVAAQVTSRTPISVLVAKQIRPGLERVLICTSGMDVAERVVRTGAWLAKATDAQAIILHVVTPVASMYTGLSDIEETLPQLLQTDTPIARHLRRGAEILAQEQMRGELRLRYGVAAGEILREAHEGDYDLIVIGASGATSKLKGWLLGNVTRQVVEQVSCSVLVVKHEAPP